MNIIFQFLLFLSLSFLPLMAWAGGAVDAIRQRQIMEQKAAIEQELVRRQQQQMIQQYMAAYQQAAIQQYVAAQRDAMAMRAAQEQAAAQFMAQRMAEEMMAYQSMVARRDQMLAQQAVLQIKVMQGVQQQAVQAIQSRQYAQQYAQQAAVQQMAVLQQQKSLAEYQQMLMAKEIVNKAANDQVQQAYAVKTAQQVQQVMAYKAVAESMNKDRLYEDIPSSYVKDVVSVSELWKSLDKSSKAWPLIIDKKAKGVTISHYIQKLSEDGAKIRKDPMLYADMIDSMSKENRSMLLQPMIDLVRIMAIIEYDYDNGIDKDALARRIFPDEASFQNNKKRLGL